MKKVLSVLLVVMLAASLFACGPVEKEDITANPITKDDIKVGVIHIGDPADGAGYSYAHDQGIVGMQKNLSLKDSQIVRKNNVNDSDAAATKTAIEECIEDGCNIIFGTSWGYMETMQELAKEYPNVIFSHGTGYMSDGNNFNNYFGRIYQARYLAGIAAGLKTKSNKIGYVAAWGSDNAEVTGGLDAFAKGIAAVNPDAEVYVKTTDSWFDLAKEGDVAQALIDLGCDVIGQHCDTTAPQLKANAANVWGCGYNTDMTTAAPNAHLTAPIWNWDVYYTSAVQAAIDGKWVEFGNYFGGLKEGFVDISPLTANCAEGTADIIAAVRALIVSGEFEVFDGKQIQVAEDGTVSVVDEALKDNKGNEIVAAGGDCLSDSTITGAINWYYENVVEK
ncbi:MAG: BMP family ABC transporter substrate-binding protein [Clostridia bacterium]|nr:BMP family ABC transporter substrate-binding protein [Clostridia bacterium]